MWSILSRLDLVWSAFARLPRYRSAKSPKSCSLPKASPLCDLRLKSGRGTGGADATPCLLSGSLLGTLCPEHAGPRMISPVLRRQAEPHKFHHQEQDLSHAYWHSAPQSSQQMSTCCLCNLNTPSGHVMSLSIWWHLLCCHAE